MSDLGIALIAAGSAIAGSLVTGWYTRSAGIRQAEAARHAGDRQADALLDTVHMTMDRQAVERVLDLRRRTYVAFLGEAEDAIAADRTGSGRTGDTTVLQRALAALTLEGPSDVADAARDIVECLRRHRSPDDLERVKLAFVSAAQNALAVPPVVPK